MPLTWEDSAWLDYEYWQTQDRKTLRRINALLRDIRRAPFDGIGKPELLHGNLRGLWSRRIDEQNRIVYYVEGDNIHIVSCRTHYNKQ